MRTATVPANRASLAYDRLVPLPGGHRLFHLTDEAHPFADRWAIADRSGEAPWTTDDGTLLVAEAAVIELGTRHIALPLEQVNGDGSLTPTRTEIAPRDVLVLSTTLGLGVSAPDGGVRHFLVATP